MNGEEWMEICFGGGALRFVELDVAGERKD